MKLKINEGSLIAKVNYTDKEYDSKVTMQQLFFGQVKKTPNATALIYNHKCLTYKELNEASNSLAWKLRECGVGNNSIVPIIADRSLEMMIGIYAIIKAGAAYLPIAKEYPVNRSEYIINESNCKVVLCEDDSAEKISHCVDCIDIKDTSLYSDNINELPLINDGESLAYVIYTSGSTGKPKGVMIKHNSLVNRLFWMQDKYGIDSSDTLIQKTPFTFDVSVWEIFWWSFTGARLLIMKPNMEKFPQAIIQDVCDYDVTVMHFVPSMMNSFLKYVAGSNEMNRLKSLRKIFSSGEKLTLSQVRRFDETLYNNNGCTLTNLYGPTEATIDVSYYDCIPHGESEIIPIGKPIYNTKLLIMNDNDEILAPGEKGEICIVGIGVSDGYLNRENLTKEVFVKTKWFDNAVMYRTGDIGRWLEDGNIEYLGRKDYQVKIRGLRIELMEIERVIESYQSGIKSTVVKNDINESNININAFVETGNKIEVTKLKNYLRQHLTEYMIPNNIVILNEIPLTENGKVDRKKLEMTKVCNNKMQQGDLYE